jgi:hypothetical protein
LPIPSTPKSSTYGTLDSNIFRLSISLPLYQSTDWRSYLRSESQVYARKKIFGTELGGLYIRRSGERDLSIYLIDLPSRIVFWKSCHRKHLHIPHNFSLCYTIFSEVYPHYCVKQHNNHPLWRMSIVGIVADVFSTRLRGGIRRGEHQNPRDL